MRIFINKLKILDPWTETSHYFTFYDEPQISQISPIEGKTSETTEVYISASLKKPFSTRKILLLIFHFSLCDYYRRRYN